MEAALDRQFNRNRIIAAKLLQYLPSRDRRVILIWFAKLDHMNNNIDQMLTRNNYLWFIILMLQNKDIIKPFKRLPPPHILPLQKFVPLQVYREVIVFDDPGNIIIPETQTENCEKTNKKSVRFLVFDDEHYYDDDDEDDD